MTSHEVTSPGSFSSDYPSGSLVIPNVWTSLESAWGSPIGYVSFLGKSASNGSGVFTFSCSSSPDYWIVPRYNVTYKLGESTSVPTIYATYSNYDFVVSAGDWELVDSVSTNTFFFAGEDITFSYDLYKFTYTSNASSISLRLLFKGPSADYFGLYTFGLPIFAPQAFSSTGSGDESGSPGDLEQWNAVIDRIDRVNDYLSSVDNTLTDVKDYIKYPDSNTTSKVEDVQTKVEEVSVQIDQAIKDMSIPPVDVTINSVNFGNGLSTVAKIQNSLLVHPLLLPIVTVGVSCWVIKLLLFGNK